MIARELSIGEPNTPSAIVEFICGNQATAWRDSVYADQLVFKSANGREYQVSAWLIPTLSFPPTRLIKLQVEHGLTRTLGIKNIPTATVWFLVSVLAAMVELVDATYLTGEQALIIQLTSVSDASSIYEIIQSGLLDFLATDDSTCDCEPREDDSTANPQTLISLCNVVEPISKQRFVKEYNKEPFNSYWPEKYFYIMSLCNLHPRSQAPTLSESGGGEEPISDESSEVDADDKVSTQYRIIGSTVVLTRHKNSWSLSNDDARKLLMANTLYDPKWAKDWDEYFSASKLINIRTWEQYGKVARHRRQVAKDLGLDEGAATFCQAGCNEGCTSIRRTPPAEAVKTYLASFDDDNVTFQYMF
jgi:hypothetical protein